MGFKKHYLIFALILFIIFLLRFPSLFEPFWYGDEGIFAAVARNLNFGGTLYQTAWDNKPPFIYLTYAGIFQFFGVSMFWIRLVTLIFVLSTAACIYEIAQHIFSQKRALIATFLFGFLTSLRIVEGNLSLTEIFMILPITFAMMLVILRKADYVSLFLAGILFAVASLYKQVGILEAGAIGIFVLLTSKHLAEAIKKCAVLALGAFLPFVIVSGYFLSRGILNEFIFGAYTYYRIYLNESPRYAFITDILKFLPIVSAILYGIYKRLYHKEVEIFHLILLWMAFSFLGSFFSGRTYGHYLVQGMSALSLLLASISLQKIVAGGKLQLKNLLNPKITGAIRIAFFVFFFIPIIILVRTFFIDFFTGAPINQWRYWTNFLAYSLGTKSQADYNNFFDSNVNAIMSLSDFIKTKGNHVPVYIWGDYSWLYAISDADNPSRYVTSFHVFGVPNGKEEVSTQLQSKEPQYIIKPPSSIGYFPELESLLSKKYTLLFTVEKSDVYAKKVQ